MFDLSAGRRRLRAAAAILTAASIGLLAACGGGSSGGETESPPPPPPTLSATSSATATTAGGDTITLTATTTNATAPVTWTLTGPGTLSAAQGESITYTPPAADDLTADAAAQIKASLGDQQQTLSIDVAMLRGRAWTIAAYPKTSWVDALYAGGLYIVAGGDSTMLSSPDLVHWTPSWTGSSGYPTAVIRSATGFLAVGYGGPVASSTDGKTWTALAPIETDGSVYFDAAAYGGGRYVAVGNGRFYASADGVAWKESPSNTMYYAKSVAFGNGRFVAAGNQSLLYSDDGVAWQPGFIQGYFGAQSVVFGNGRFVALASDANVYISTNGIDWQQGGMPAQGQYDGKLVFSGGQYYLVIGAGVFASADGLAWTQVFTNPAIGEPLMAFAAGPAGYVVGGYANVLQQSADLKSWSAVSDMPMVRLSGVDCMGDVCVVIGADGTVLRSTDALHWTSATLDDALVSITHSNGSFLGVSASKVYTSADGKEWTATALNAGNGLAAAAYGDGRYVIVGANALILTSTDAKSWTAVPSGIAGNIALGSVTYGGGRFVAAGNPGVFLTSTDGQAWTLGASVGGTMFSVASGPAGYVAVGGGLIWQSTDGLNWTSAASGTPNDLYSITYANGQYVAVGGFGTILASHDGIDWAKRDAGINGYFYGVAYGNGVFVTVGEFGTIVSSDH